MNTVIYLYGFVAATVPAPPSALRGIADAAVRLVPLGDIAAVASDVPAADFDAALIEARMEDIAWVGEQGVAHERVVLWYVDHADILPARLFSLHSGEAALRSATAPQQHVIADRLRRFAGLREWNLKVAYDADELTRHGAEVSDELRALDADIAGAPPGRRYLLERKRADVLKREVGRAARRLAAELLAELGADAAEVRTLPLAGGDDTGAVVLNGALLVARDREADFRARADAAMERVRRFGLRPALSGPWAPYRFLEADVSA